jgi:hypothetical protein
LHRQGFRDNFWLTYYRSVSSGVVNHHSKLKVYRYH